MTAWKPAQLIRTKVVGLVWRDGSLLAAEVLSADGTLKGVRPLGGSIDFGETREQALRREFCEELGVDIAFRGAWLTLENLFEHEGAVGHEFVFAAEVQLLDESLYRRDRIPFLESDGTSCIARWFDPLRMPDGVALYPAGLAAQLTA